MFQIVIVDDEEIIVEGLQFLVEKLVPDCQVAGVAYDGEEGYEKVLELKPDIVLTDIRMNDMDGIEMIRRLVAKHVKSRFIILSGYSEFEDAKKAIQLGVEDYIVKPIEEELLCKTLKKVCLSIQDDYSNKKKVNDLERKVESFSQDMKEYLLRDILEYDGKSSKEMLERIQATGFPVDYKHYICAVYHYYNKQNENVYEIFCDRLWQACFKGIQDAYVWELLRYNDAQIVLIVASSTKIDEREMKRVFGAVRRACVEGEISISVGIGLIHHTIKGVKKSFEEARCAVNYRVIKGANAVIAYDELREIESQPYRVSETDVKKLENCMDDMDNEGCSAVIEEIFQKLNKEDGLSPEDLQVISVNLILAGIRKMPFMQMQINEFLGEDILSVEKIARFESMEQLKNMIINILGGMNEIMMKQNIPEKRDVIEEVKKYVRKNFDREIPLAEISEKFFINPSYFSHLFKKRTGQTYRAYLAEIRMNRAKKLLEETNLKIYEVSELVGYQDVNHFNRVFERAFSVKPGELKKSI